MLKVTQNLMLPTAITGSYPRPLWFTETITGSDQAAHRQPAQIASAQVLYWTRARVRLLKSPAIAVNHTPFP